MNFQNLSREIWDIYKSENWDSSIFSKKKGFLCSLLSQLTYEHIPDFELNQESRVKIFPSESYWLRYLNKETYNISNVLSEADFGENFIIENENLIVVGIKLRDTIFIAIRGTQSLNDIIVDLKFAKSPHLQDDFKFHSGFLNAILSEENNILNKLTTYSNSNIYIMGHSLGGAMSAILYDHLNTKYKNVLKSRELTLQSCYTFGMPRYANKKALDGKLFPYQFYNPNDVIALVPPRVFGYANVSEEYRLSLKNLIKKTNNGKSTLLRLWGLLTLQDFQAHSIDIYCNNLRSVL